MQSRFVNLLYTHFVITEGESAEWRWGRSIFSILHLLYITKICLYKVQTDAQLMFGLTNEMTAFDLHVKNGRVYTYRT